MTKSRILTGALATIGMLVAGTAWAQNYPNRPVHIVVPFDAGGSTDVNARYLAQTLTEQTKESFVVENRVGASGYIGANYVSTQKPDGYTLLYAGSSLTITPALTQVPIDIRTDLVAVSNIMMTPYVMVINPTIPAKTVKELIVYIKQHPVEFKWAISALGSADNLSTEVFNKLAGLKPVPLSVPYSAVNKSAMAVLSNEVSGVLSPIVTVQGMIDSGQLRAIGLAAPVAMDILPGVPTIASDFPGYEAGAWAGIFGPKGMPADLAKQIFALLMKANADKPYLEKLKTTGTLSLSSKSPEEFAGYVKSQMDSAAAIVKEVGIKLN